MEPLTDAPVEGGMTLAVIVPTYKRPAWLLRTLESLERQETAHRYAVVVVENDAQEQAGAQAARDFFARSHLIGKVVIEPRQGNCNAYNAGFAAALEAYPSLSHVAIIDDDETARPLWIETLLSTAHASGADIVGGPQVPRFEDEDGARRFAPHPVFQSAHGSSGRKGLITSTGNCLIHVRVLRSLLSQDRPSEWLDPAFNFMGGGDTDFFTRAAGKGFAFAWSSQAAVDETIPSRRTTRRWVIARSLRNGILSALIQRRQRPGLTGRLIVVAKTLALLAASPVRALLLWARTGSFDAGTYPILIAVGRLASEFGVAVEQYRQPEKN